MTAAASILFGIAAALAVWSYLVYPPLLRGMSRRTAASDESPTDAARSVEVLVSAADEEAVIGARVRNLLEQQSPGSYGIAVGCDGSRDRTAAEARNAGAGRARVVEFPERRGKASVLNDLVATSSADVLVFTDANTRFDPGAVAELLRSLSGPRTGAACGRLIFETPAGAVETPERLFWDRETSVKEAEGRLGVCLGANGAIYAARRELVPVLPADTTSMDDFLIPVGIARQGAAVVFASGAVAREAPALDTRSEASRRFRIGVGAGQVLRRERWLWNARRRPLLAFAFFSRKAARWLGPPLFLIAAAAALASPALRPFGAAVLLAVAACVLALVAGVEPRGFFRGLYYFAVINLALAAGVAAGLAGYRRPAWKPVARP